jgi:lipopolysaccharide assembly outer membrane protein LptD (OstA)
MKTFWLVLICSVLLLTVSCAGHKTNISNVNNITRISQGKSTTISKINHTKNNEEYKITTISHEYKNVEFHVDRIYVDVDDEKFGLFYTGVKYHLTKRWKYFVADFGIGLGIAEQDDRNKWLAHSWLLADVNLGFGIRKEYENCYMELMYNLQHLSVPGRSDRGMNFDTITFGITVLF